MKRKAAVALLEASARQRLPGIAAERIPLLVGAAVYLEMHVMKDGHLARSEAELIERSLADDFAPDEIAWILDAIVRYQEAVAALRGDDYWFRPLFTYLFRVGPVLPHSAWKALVMHLEGRWPLMPDATLPLVTNVTEGTSAGVQLGSPSSMSSFAIKWWSITNLEAVDPWPQVLVEWHEEGMLRRTRVAPKKSPEEFEAKVEALFDEAERRLPASKLTKGWLLRPHVRWEDVDALPSGDEEPLGGGVPYRSGSRPDRIVARRPPRRGLDVLFEWLASSPKWPFRAMPREAVVTEKYLYVERRDRRVQRVPLELLDTGRGLTDRVYRFGRRSEVLFTGADRCPVCAALDAHLREREFGDAATD